MPVRAQIGPLRRLATTALEAYAFDDPTLRFLSHGENTTFRVDARERREGSPGCEDGPQRFLLRVHRPRRHGRAADPVAAIRSELEWLAALRADTDLSVPEPVRSVEEQLVTVATGDGVPEPRCCSVLRWMDGRFHSAAPRPVHLRRLGRAMAQLHDHADSWSPPDGFIRIVWDWETFFGDTMEYGDRNAAAVWELLPTDLRRMFDVVAERTGRVMDQFGTGSDTFGLIHADLHLENTLFSGGEARLIDFDDCGFGHRMYEIAVALWELRHGDGFIAFRDELVGGYREHRELLDAQLAHLDTFIAAREVAFGLWFVGMAQVNPRFHARLDGELAMIARSLGVLVGSTR